MKLRDLDARFVGQLNVQTGGFTEQDGIEGAQGVLFQCPLCGQNQNAVDTSNGKGREGAHYVLCWFKNPRNAPGVPDSMEPGPGRWIASGSGIDDLTLAPSVNLDVHPTDKGCKWHGWVKSGEAA
jgi:Family of unknown function (DUF6527)